ncbi:MAG: tetratricopeptide repeat protein [Asticcacaulis sp.]
MKRIFGRVIGQGLLGLCLLGGTVSAQTASGQAVSGQAGRDAYITDLTRLAEAGQTEAQFKLAQAYHLGNFATANRETARLWYERAAAQGDRRARRILREFDPAEAVKQFREDAEREYQAAYLGLCEAYMTGTGVARDPAQGLTYCRKSVDPDAIYWQGLAYETGQGVEPDKVRAAQLYTQAATAGSGRAMTVLGVWALEGREDAPDAAKALKWFQKGASFGDAEAIWRLAVMYEKGLGTPADPDEAMRLYVAAAERGVEAAKTWTAAHPDPAFMTKEQKADASKKMAPTELTLITKAEDGSEVRSSFFEYAQSQVLWGYPSLAQASSVGGAAVIECRINAVRRLDNCVLISEAPLYYEFARATLRVYRREIEMSEASVKSREEVGFGRRFRTRLVWLLQ